MMTKTADLSQHQTTSTVKFLTSRVAVVQWRGYWFTVSQVRWGPLRRWLYARVYRHACPPSDVRFETAVFLSRHDGRFNPGKPLHATFQTSREEARAMLTQLVEQVADGRLAFQAFFQR
ncbi:MAG: hypothetical protein HY208_07465 [Nitrospirae bacterium]|nr:hypothetical protein [Nitrospirota bacterium]